MFYQFLDEKTQIISSKGTLVKYYSPVKLSGTPEQSLFYFFYYFIQGIEQS